MSPKQEETPVLELKLGRKVNEGNEVNQEGQSIAGHTGSITAPSMSLPTRNSASALSPPGPSLLYMSQPSILILKSVLSSLFILPLP